MALTLSMVAYYMSRYPLKCTSAGTCGKAGAHFIGYLNNQLRQNNAFNFNTLFGANEFFRITKMHQHLKKLFYKLW